MFAARLFLWLGLASLAVSGCSGAPLSVGPEPIAFADDRGTFLVDPSTGFVKAVEDPLARSLADTITPSPHRLAFLHTNGVDATVFDRQGALLAHMRGHAGFLDWLDDETLLFRAMDQKSVVRVNKRDFRAPALH